jgi:guanylate kinase
MIYVLLGATCSGKTTALETLVKRGYETVTSYTTRPKRPGELDGIDYNFISSFQYDALDTLGYLVAKNTFTSAYGDKWRYAINIMDINPSVDQFIITEPSGYRDLVQRLGKENVKSIYLLAPYDVRLARGMNRKDSTNELFRRLDADEKDFEGFEFEADFTVLSIFKDQVVDNILMFVNGDIK